MDLGTAYVIIHLIGFALGAGGAFITDAMFFTSIRDRVISKTEIRFIELGGHIVWFGLGILFISGLLLTLQDPAYYFASSKFQVKMTIVACIALNGVIIHRFHTPVFRRSLGKQLNTHPEFQHRIPIMLVSGVVSTVSWLSALVLGSLRTIPYTYGEGMALYVLVIMAGVIAGFLVHPYAFRVLWKLK